MAACIFAMMLDHVFTAAGDAFADAFGRLFAEFSSSGTNQTLRVGLLWGIFAFELTADAFGALFA
jgi:hypothetical protein